MDRVLITGITGFAGSYLALELLRRGVEVYGLIRHRSDGSNLWRLRYLDIEDMIVKIPGDVTDFSSVKQAIDIAEPDVIFHLAAQSYVPRSFEAPIETLLSNSLGTQNVLEAARLSKYDPRIVFAGSSEEYGIQIVSEKHYEELKKKYGVIEPPPTRIPEIPINEWNPLRPVSPYSVSKVHGDYLCRMYWKAYGVKCIVSRAFNHEGPLRSDHFVTSVVTRQVAEIAAGYGREILIGDVNVFRDWSHVEDIVEGYLLIAEKGRPGDVYVQGSARTNSVLTLILLALDVAGYHPERIRGLRGGPVVADPLEPADTRAYGFEFYLSRVDALILSGDLRYELRDEGIIVETSRGPVRIRFDPARFRPSDVPVLMSDPRRVMREFGFKVKHSLRDVVKSMYEFYKKRITGKSTGF